MPRRHHLPHPLLAALAIALTLTACVPAVVVGGATAGAIVAADRRSIEQQRIDEEIETIVARRLKENFADRINVNGTAYNQTLLLTGEIPTAELKTQVMALIQLTPRVKRTVDETRVTKLSETRWRLNDSAITTAVKTRLGQSGKVEVSAIKVVTEANSVYLLGRVTQTEADGAIEVARNTSGVSRVVNVFEIVSPEALSRQSAAR